MVEIDQASQYLSSLVCPGNSEAQKGSRKFYLDGVFRMRFPNLESTSIGACGLSAIFKPLLGGSRGYSVP